MHIPVLISDLAIMLITAGLITILFKKIKQPLVLGYLLAGFLLSSYFPFLPGLSDMESIKTWSEIGIIFLMFHLGLEFNLHRLAQVGNTAIITALVEVTGILVLGFGAGRLLGFSTMDSIFLGGMLSMSSTTIIIKAFDELQLKGEKFTDMVFGTLVVEDIVGIFMMVILSTISVSKNVSGTEVVLDLSLMILYLVVWLILGIYFLPTFLNKNIRFMNDEMLLIISIGVCFGMVILADALGFSSALGAFLAGSLLAGTLHVERIEHLTKGVKDLFGAIFFLSVGMMVNPRTLIEFVVPIAVITLVTILGKLVFSSVGMLLSGQTLGNSLKGGFSLAQIGEFAFIIASLGMNLGVTGDYLYPIVVSVSVITTFTTPFFIKLSDKAVTMVERILPESVIKKIGSYTAEDQTAREQDNQWYSYIKKTFLSIVVFGGLMLAIVLFGMNKLYPSLGQHMGEGGTKIVTCVIMYLLVAIFVGPLMGKHDRLFTALWLKGRSFRLPLLMFSMTKVAVVGVIVSMPMSTLFNVHPALLFAIAIVVVAFLVKTDILTTWYLELQTKFLRNFNERLLNEEEREHGKQTWVYDKIHIVSITVDNRAPFVNRHLKALEWGKKYNVYLVKVTRGEHHYILPKKDFIIHVGDKIYVMGEKNNILNFYKKIDMTPCVRMRTMHQFMESGYGDEEHALSVGVVKIAGHEKFAGKAIKSGRIREDWNCMIIGIQREGYPVVMPNANRLISKGDILWIVGSNNNIGRLMGQYIEK